jgi:hypothetical protein
MRMVSDGGTAAASAGTGAEFAGAVASGLEGVVGEVVGDAGFAGVFEGPGSHPVIASDAARRAVNR